MNPPAPPRLTVRVDSTRKETTMTTDQPAAGYEYTVSRVVDAPVEKVWAVWTPQ